jgi:hypothetical protein
MKQGQGAKILGITPSRRLVRFSQPNVTGCNSGLQSQTRSIRCRRRRSWSVIQSRLAHAARGRSLNRASGKPLPSRSGMPLTISR